MELGSLEVGLADHAAGLQSGLDRLVGVVPVLGPGTQVRGEALGLLEGVRGSGEGGGLGHSMSRPDLDPDLGVGDQFGRRLLAVGGLHDAASLPGWVGGGLVQGLGRTFTK